MSYVGGLATGYMFLGTVLVMGDREECYTGQEYCYNPIFCKFAGYTIYFSFMTSFFWLNTMCFDIFWTFRAVQSNWSARKKFIYYCVYAWGMASFLTLFVIILDQFKTNDLRPAIGEKNCFIKSKILKSQFHA